MPNRTKVAPRKKMGPRTHALLRGLEEVLAYARGKPKKGTRIDSFYKRKGKWVRRTKIVK